MKLRAVFIFCVCALAAPPLAAQQTEAGAIPFETYQLDNEWR